MHMAAPTGLVYESRFLSFDQYKLIYGTIKTDVQNVIEFLLSKVLTV